MPIIRNFREKSGICVFDEVLDTSFSTYDRKHLTLLENSEPFHFWFKTRAEYLCQIFHRFVDKKARILEVGSGTGFIAAKLQTHGYQVEVSDIYSSGLHYAQKKGCTTLYQFDLFLPPFEEEFDVICFFDVLEHLEDPQKALLCLKNMLKAKGLIILTVPAHKWLWSREDRIAGHKRRLTKHVLRQLFTSADLQSLALRYFFRSLIPLLLLRKWLKPDHLQPSSAHEEICTQINPWINQILYRLIQCENRFDRFLPNYAGGSLLGVAQKN